jgi:hypothetical protein
MVVLSHFSRTSTIDERTLPPCRSSFGSFAMLLAMRLGLVHREDVGNVGIGSKLAAALTFRQRRIVLKAISLAVDRLRDRALSGFCLLSLIISGGRSITRRMP